MSGLSEGNYNINTYMSRIYDESEKCHLTYSEIDLSKTTTNSYICFSVPVNYDVLHIYRQYSYKRNGTMSYCEFNVTGDAFELSKTNNAASYHSPILWNSQGETNNYKCRNYVLKNNCKSSSIKFVLKKLDVDPVVHTAINYTTTNNSKVKQTSYFVQDSEYNSTHWMNSEDLKYLVNDI